MIMMKLPIEVPPLELKNFIGTLGTVLNPIQDLDGDFVVSMEEWNSEEFAYLKVDFPELAALFTEKEFKPIIDEYTP